MNQIAGLSYENKEKWENVKLNPYTMAMKHNSGITDKQSRGYINYHEASSPPWRITERKKKPKWVHIFESIISFVLFRAYYSEEPFPKLTSLFFFCC